MKTGTVDPWRQKFHIGARTTNAWDIAAATVVESATSMDCNSTAVDLHHIEYHITATALMLVGKMIGIAAKDENSKLELDKTLLQNSRILAVVIQSQLSPRPLLVAPSSNTAFLAAT